MFTYARNEQCDLGPIYAVTNMQRIRIYPGKLKFIPAKISPDPGQRKQNSIHVSYYPDSPVHRSVNTEHIQVCCEFTWVNAFTR